jgi:hypothetical protein
VHQHLLSAWFSAVIHLNWLGIHPLKIHYHQILISLPFHDLKWFLIHFQFALILELFPRLTNILFFQKSYLDHQIIFVLNQLVPTNTIEHSFQLSSMPAKKCSQTLGRDFLLLQFLLSLLQSLAVPLLIALVEHLYSPSTERL